MSKTMPNYENIKKQSTRGVLLGFSLKFTHSLKHAYEHFYNVGNCSLRIEDYQNQITAVSAHTEK